MRLFTGISLPFEVRRNIELLFQHLQPLAAIHWSPAANLHVTTKFIGEWAEAQLPQLKQALRAQPRAGAFAIDIGGLGWFPNPHHPKVFFAGVRAAHTSLHQLASATDAALTAIGTPTEAREYSPHLTLARIKTGVPLLPLKQAIAGLPSVDFGRIDVRKFNLYASVPGEHASAYTVLEEFPL